MRSIRRLTRFLLAAIAVSAAAAPAPSCAAGPGADRVVLRLDDARFAVTEADIAGYQATQRCYPEGLDSRKAAFMRQLEPAVLSSLLQAGALIEISTAALAEEEARVDRETKAPDILACIKAHFGSDRERYRRVYLRPILVQKEFYRYLAYDRKVQAKAYADAERFARAMGAEPFPMLAARLGLDYSSAAYRAEGEGGSPEGERSAFEAYFIDRHLRDLAPGKPRLEPVDSDSDLLFIKLLEKTGALYRFETVRVRKLTLNRFLDARPKLRAEVYDPELKAWLKGIVGNPYLGVLDIR